MARYSVAAAAAKATVNATDKAMWSLKAGTTKSVVVYEVGVFLESGTAAAIGFALLRMNAVGTGAITSDAPTAEDPALGAASAVLEKSWATTDPTVTGNALRRGTTPATIGTGFIWVFPAPGLIIPAAGGLVIAQTAAATTANLRCYVAFDEN
ncbi:hypothetical protein ABZU94_10395 [Streptomyces mirabilis]|uniref:hypothetical protein n=1 Tax=Streptomyces sp. NPDC005388 TaxID=3156717 RepID=UPI0033B8A807